MASKANKKNKEFLYKLNESQKTKLPRLPSNIDFEEVGNTIKITLSAGAVAENMQTDSAAFEGWAVIFHKITGKDILIDIKEKSDDGTSWEKIGEKKSGHYNRFLYRIMKFDGSYSFVSISQRLKKHYGEFYFKNKYVRFDSSELYVNKPTSEAGCNDKTEIQIEKKISESSNALIKKTEKLFGITMMDKLYRQLPVGIFNKDVRKDNAVFTGSSSAIDLWGISEDKKTLCVYELKADNNKKVGIISELFFYANLLFDIYSDNKNFFTLKNKKKNYRGYELLQNLSDIHKVCAVFLSPELHPEITDNVINKLNTKYIEYRKINYNTRIDVIII